MLRLWITTLVFLDSLHSFTCQTVSPGLEFREYPAKVPISAPRNFAIVPDLPTCLNHCQSNSGCLQLSFLHAQPSGTPNCFLFFIRAWPLRDDIRYTTYSTPIIMDPTTAFLTSTTTSTSSWTVLGTSTTSAISSAVPTPSPTQPAGLDLQVTSTIPLGLILAIGIPCTLLFLVLFLSCLVCLCHYSRREPRSSSSNDRIPLSPPSPRHQRHHSSSASVISDTMSSYHVALNLPGRSRADDDTASVLSVQVLNVGSLPRGSSAVGSRLLGYGGSDYNPPYRAGYSNTTRGYDSEYGGTRAGYDYGGGGGGGTFNGFSSNTQHQQQQRENQNFTLQAVRTTSHMVTPLPYKQGYSLTSRLGGALSGKMMTGGGGLSGPPHASLIIRDSTRNNRLEGVHNWNHHTQSQQYGVAPAPAQQGPAPPQYDSLLPQGPTPPRDTGTTSWQLSMTPAPLSYGPSSTTTTPNSQIQTTSSQDPTPNSHVPIYSTVNKQRMAPAPSPQRAFTDTAPGPHNGGGGGEGSLSRNITRITVDEDRTTQESSAPGVNDQSQHKRRNKQHGNQQQQQLQQQQQQHGQQHQPHHTQQQQGQQQQQQLSPEDKDKRVSFGATPSKSILKNGLATGSIPTYSEEEEFKNTQKHQQRDNESPLYDRPHGDDDDDDETGSDVFEWPPPPPPLPALPPTIPQAPPPPPPPLSRTNATLLNKKHMKTPLD